MLNAPYLGHTRWGLNEKEMKTDCYYLGIRGVHLIWHGEWADPELMYRNKVANYYDVETTMYGYFKNEFPMVEGETDKEYSDRFDKYCKDNACEVKNLIIEYAV